MSDIERNTHSGVRACSFGVSNWCRKPASSGTWSQVPSQYDKIEFITKLRRTKRLNEEREAVDLVSINIRIELLKGNAPWSQKTIVTVSRVKNWSANPVGQDMSVKYYSRNWLEVDVVWLKPAWYQRSIVETWNWEVIDRTVINEVSTIRSR